MRASEMGDEEMAEALVRLITYCMQQKGGMVKVCLFIFYANTTKCGAKFLFRERQKTIKELV
jgi:hypothetical protein